MNKFKRVWSNLFGVSAGEYAGFRGLVLTALICVVGLALANYLSKSPYNNYEKDVKLLDSLLLVMQKEKLEQIAKPIFLVLFDPNTASADELESVGFPNWLANRLVNYRATGARFNKPKDLLKLYGFPESLYMQLADYIIIKPLAKPKNKIVKATKKYQPKAISKAEEKLPLFDLNMADTSIFQTIYGVGSKLSNRIVTYRNALGGFVSKNQLYQVYGLDSAVINKIADMSEINFDFNPVKIEINKAKKEQLAAHPYINWKQAKLIIAYRNQHGSYTNAQELLKVYSINENWVKKVAPYLTF